MAADRVTRQLMGSGATVADSSPDAVVRLFNERQGGVFFGSSFSGEGPKGLIYTGYKDPVTDSVFRGPVDSKVTLFYGDAEMSGFFSRRSSDGALVANGRIPARATFYAPDKRKEGNRLLTGSEGSLISERRISGRARLGEYSHIKIAYNEREAVFSTANYGKNAYSKQDNVDIGFTREKNPELYNEAVRISKWLTGGEAPKDLKHFMLAGDGKIRAQMIEDISKAKDSITLTSANLKDNEIVNALKAAAIRGVKIDITLSTADYHKGGETMEHHVNLLSVLGSLKATTRVDAKSMHANAMVVDDITYVGDTRYNEMLDGSAASATLRVKGNEELNEKVRKWIQSKGVQQKLESRATSELTRFLDVIAPRVSKDPKAVKVRHMLNPEAFLPSLQLAAKQGMDLSRFARTDLVPGLTENIARSLVYDKYKTWDYRERLGADQLETLRRFDAAMQSPTFGQTAVGQMLFGGAQEGSRGLVSTWLHHATKWLDRAGYEALPEHLRPKSDEMGPLESVANVVWNSATAMMLSSAGFVFLGQPMMRGWAYMMRRGYERLSKGESKFAKTLTTVWENTDNALKLTTGEILKDVIAPRLKVISPLAEIVEKAGDAFLKAPALRKGETNHTFAGIMYNVNATLNEFNKGNPDTAILDRKAAKHGLTRWLSSEGLGRFFFYYNTDYLIDKVKATGQMIKGAYRTIRPSKSARISAENTLHDLNNVLPMDKVEFEEWLDRFVERGQLSTEHKAHYLEDADARSLSEAHFDAKRALNQRNFFDSRQYGKQQFWAGLKRGYGFNTLSKVLGAHEGTPLLRDYKRAGWVGFGALVLGDFILGQIASLGQTTPWQQGQVEDVLNSISDREVRVERRMGWDRSVWGTLTAPFQLAYRGIHEMSKVFARDSRFKDQSMAPGMYSEVLLRSRAGVMSEVLGRSEAIASESDIGHLSMLKAPDSQEQALLDMKIMLTQAMTINSMDHPATTRTITGLAAQFAPISRFITLTASASNLGDNKLAFGLTLQGPVSLKVGIGAQLPWVYDPLKDANGFSDGVFGTNMLPMLNPGNYTYTPGTSGEALAHIATDLLALRAVAKTVEFGVSVWGKLSGDFDAVDDLRRTAPWVYGRTAYGASKAVPGMAVGTASKIQSRLMSGSRWGALATMATIAGISFAADVVGGEGTQMNFGDAAFHDITTGIVLGGAATALQWRFGTDWAVRRMLTSEGSTMNKILNYAAGKPVSVVSAESAHDVVKLTGQARVQKFKELTGVDFSKTAKEASVQGFWKRQAHDFIRARVYERPQSMLRRAAGTTGKAVLAAATLGSFMAFASSISTAFSHDDTSYYHIKEGFRKLPGGDFFASWWQNYQGFESRTYDAQTGTTHYDLPAALPGNKIMGFNVPAWMESRWNRFKKIGGYAGASDPFASTGSQGATWEFDERGNMRWAAYFVQTGFGPFQVSAASKLAVTSYSTQQEAYYAAQNMLAAKGQLGAYNERLRAVKKSARVGKMFHHLSANNTLSAAGKAEVARRSALTRWILGNNMGADWMVYNHLSRSPHAAPRIFENHGLYSARGYIGRTFRRNTQADAEISQTGRTGLGHGALLDQSVVYSELPEYEQDELQRLSYLDEMASVTGKDLFSGFGQQTLLDSKAITSFVAGSAVAASLPVGYFLYNSLLKRPKGEGIWDAIKHLPGALKNLGVIGEHLYSGGIHNTYLTSVAFSPVDAEGTVFRLNDVGDRPAVGLTRGRLHSPKNVIWLMQFGGVKYHHSSTQMMLSDPLGGTDTSPLRGRFTLEELLRGSSDDGKHLGAGRLQKSEILRLARNPMILTPMHSDRAMFTQVQKIIESADILSKGNDFIGSQKEIMEFVRRVEGVQKLLTKGIEGTTRAAGNVRNTMVVLGENSAQYDALFGEGKAEQRLAQLNKLQADYGDNESGVIKKSLDWLKKFKTQTEGFAEIKQSYEQLNDLVKRVSAARNSPVVLSSESIYDTLRGISADPSIAEDALEKFRGEFQTIEKSIEEIAERMHIASDWTGNSSKSLIEARGFVPTTSESLPFFSHKGFIIRAENSMTSVMRLHVARAGASAKHASEWLKSQSLLRAELSLENFLNNNIDMNKAGNKGAAALAEELKQEWAMARMIGSGDYSAISEMPAWSSLSDMWVNPGEGSASRGIFSKLFGSSNNRIVKHMMAIESSYRRISSRLFGSSNNDLRKRLIEHMMAVESSYSTKAMFRPGTLSAGALVMLGADGAGGLAKNIGYYGIGLPLNGVMAVGMPLSSFGSAAYLSSISHTGQLDAYDSARARRDAAVTLARGAGEAAVFGAAGLGASALGYGFSSLRYGFAGTGNIKTTKDVVEASLKTMGKSGRVATLGVKLAMHTQTLGRLLTGASKLITGLQGTAAAYNATRVAMVGANAVATFAAWDTIAAATLAGAQVGATIGGGLGAGFGAIPGAVLGGVVGFAGGLAVGLGVRDLMINAAASLAIMGVAYATGALDKAGEYMTNFVSKKIEDYANTAKPGSLTYGFLSSIAAVTEWSDGVRNWMIDGANSKHALLSAQLGREATWSDAPIAETWRTILNFTAMVLPGLDRRSETMQNVLSPIPGRTSISNNPEKWTSADGSPNLALSNLTPIFYGSMYDATIRQVRNQEALMRSSNAMQVVNAFISGELMGQAPTQPPGPLKDAPEQAGSLMKLFTGRLERPSDAMQFQMRERALFTQHIFRRLLDRRDEFGNRAEKYGDNIGPSGYGPSEIGRPWAALRGESGVRERFRLTPEQAQENDPNGPGISSAPGTGNLAGGAMTVANSILTSLFGPRRAPRAGASSFHRGIDVGWAHGTQVNFNINGLGEAVVTNAGWLKGYGNSVQLTLPDGRTVFFAHLSRMNVKVGQKFAGGVINIGRVGNTGIGTGAHLHFETGLHGAQVNPMSKSTIDLTRRVSGGTPILRAVRHHDHEAEHAHPARHQAVGLSRRVDARTISNTPEDNASGVLRWMSKLKQAEAATGVRATLLAALMQTESSGNPNALAYEPTGYGKAAGLFQFVPPTGASMGFKNTPGPRSPLYMTPTVEGLKAIGDERLDPNKSIQLTTNMLADWIAKWGERAAIVAHHLGPGARGAVDAAYVNKVYAHEQAIIRRISLSRSQEQSRRDVRQVSRPAPGRPQIQIDPAQALILIRQMDPSSSGRRDHVQASNSSRREGGR